jgi:hypothetical protein
MPSIRPATRRGLHPCLVALTLVGSLLASASATADSEPNNNIAEFEGPIQGGVSVAGSLHDDRDQDWYAFYVSGQQQLAIHVSKTQPGPCDPDVYFLDTDGGQVDWAEPDETNAQTITYTTPPGTSRYFLAAADGCDGTAYAVRVDPAAAVVGGPARPQPQDIPEPNEFKSQAWGPLAGGTDYRAAFETQNDAEWLVFHTAAGQHQLDIAVTNPGGGSGCDVESRLEFAGDEEYGWLEVGVQRVDHHRFTSNRAQTGYLSLDGCVGDRFLLNVSPSSALSATPPASSNPPPPTPVAPGPQDPGAAPPASTRPIVLGSPGYMGRYGKGWGKVRPNTIFNGGVPSGLVKKIRWRDWGRAIAYGRGKVAIYRPRGGYFNRLGRVKLRASRIGKCPGSSRRAYTKLMVRVQRRPGGRYRKWRNWAGDTSICRRS